MIKLPEYEKIKNQLDLKFHVFKILNIILVPEKLPLFNTCRQFELLKRKELDLTFFTLEFH